jgi:hypothetical protein
MGKDRVPGRDLGESGPMMTRRDAVPEFWTENIGRMDGQMGSLLLTTVPIVNTVNISVGDE